MKGELIMNNIELETKIKEIIKIENYFDMVVAANRFDREYKTSDFYKQTKKSLYDVIKESKIHYALQLQDLSTKIQTIIDNLDLNKINEILDQIGQTFGQENGDIRELINNFKDIVQ